MEDKKFLTYFDELIAAQKQTAQRSALFKIIKVLQQNKPTSSSLESKFNYGANCNPNVGYTLARFIKGMASQSASVQQGFYLGFTLLLHYFRASIDLKLLLKSVHKLMMRAPHALKPTQNCQRVIGEIMLLRGICIVYFTKQDSKNHEIYQKAVSNLDEFIGLVARLYEQNVKMVLGKRGGQSKNLYKLWYSLASHVLLTFTHSSSQFVKVINVFLDKLLDVERTETQLNIEWVASRVALQIIAKHLALENGISLVQIPLIPESFLNEILQAQKEQQDFSCLASLSSALGIHPVIELISAQYIWVHLKNPKIAEEAKQYFEQIPVHFEQQPLIILYTSNAALSKIKQIINEKQEFSILQSLSLLMTNEFGLLLGKIFANKFPKKERPGLKEQASQTISLMNDILKSMVERSLKSSHEVVIKIMFNLFSSPEHLVLSVQNRAILHSLTKLIQNGPSGKEKKKSVDRVLTKIEKAINSQIEEIQNQKEENSGLGKNLERVVYQINLLSEITQTANQNEQLSQILFKILGDLSQKQDKFAVKIRAHCLQKLIVTAKPESLKQLCQKMKQIYASQEDTNLTILDKALEIGMKTEKSELKSVGKMLKKRKHSQTIKPQKLKSLENLSYAIALTECLSEEKKEDTLQEDEKEPNEALQDLQDIQLIIEKLNSQSSEQDQSPNPLDVLFDLLVSQLTKQSAFLREYVYGAFKAMLEDINESSVMNILDVISTPTQLAHGMLTL